MEFSFIGKILLKFICYFCTDNFQEKLSTDPLHPTVETNYGVIEGFGISTSFGFNADVFLGIPYAKPPTNELRFEKPEPPEKWSKPLLAKTFGKRCATWPLSDKNASEDCLTLNIVRPSKPENDSNDRKYPVMLFIHGGDFLTGSSADYSYVNVAENLVSKAIVFVSINYRLGAFGFYSTGNDFAPGNYGLWDQVQALKFIKEIIDDFDGDPNRITIFGESAGASSVSWLTLNPDLEDVFYGAISLSGSHQAIWANGDTTVQTSKKINQIIQCDKVEDLKRCIQKPTTEEILSAMKQIMSPSLLRVDTPEFSFFHPRIDGDFIDAVDFKQAIKDAPKRPNFIGVDSQEDIAFALDRTHSNRSKFFPLPYYRINRFKEANFTEAINYVLGTEDAYGDKAKNAAKNIIDFYSKNENYRKNFFLQTYVQVFSDIHFNVPALREAKEKAVANFGVYFYRYSYVPPEHKDPDVDGARHGTELLAIFGAPENTDNSDDKKEAHKNFIDLIVSFAKYGVPKTHEDSVPRVTADKVPFVDVNAKTTVKNNLWPDRVLFWDKQASNYGYDWPSGLEQ